MYLPFFDIVVEHQFFLNGMRRTLTVTPTAETEPLAAATGLVIRQTPNGIRVLYEVHRLEALQHYASQTSPAVHLSFKLATTDHLFARYTEPSCPTDQLFYFDASSSQAETDDTYRLHPEPQVSEHTLAPIGAPPLNALLAPADHPLLGLIHLPLSPSTAGVFDPQYTVTPRTYIIRFAARHAYWDYYLLNTFARDDLYMEDAEGNVEFENIGKVSLPDQQVAQVFRTTTPLPLRDRYHNRFQIVDPHASGDRILMARMPGPEARQTDQERLNGVEVSIAKIFIKGF